MKRKLVVIGNGMVGARLVEEVLARGGAERFDVTMFGDEPYGNYNRILLSGVLAGSHAPEDIFLNPLAWYERHRIRLHAGVRVTAIDRDRKTVRADDETVTPYDDLVIATGSVPFIPPLEGGIGPNGAPVPGLFAFRTLDDTDAIVRAATGARHAVVLGGGLLGLEAARGLLARGVDTTVVHLMGHLMELQLDPAAGALLRKSLEAMGVRIRVATRTTAVLGRGRVEGLAFDDGSSLACDLVVVSAGIRPNAQLARDAGLIVRRGIVVGDDLASPDDPTIRAVGECTEHRGVCYGLVAPLWEQCTVLADRLTGRDAAARYAGSRLSTKLKVAGVELATMGDVDAVHPDDEVVSYVEPARGVYKKLVVRRNRLAGAIVLGDGATVPVLVQAFDRQSELPDHRAELLFPLAGGGAPTAAADLPDDAQLCNCNGVTKGAVVTAVRDGHCTLKAVCDATRAGTGCGACKPQVQAVLESVAGDRVAEDPSVHWYVPGVPLTKPALVDAIRAQTLRSVSAVFNALAGGRHDPASKPGLASLLRTLWGAAYEDERDARFINDRVHANIQKDASFSVIPRIYGGVTSPAQLRRIADVADRYAVPMVKITGGQRIDLLGIRREQLPNVWRDLDMPSGHAYSKAFRTCKTCVGTEFCRYGVGDSTALGIAIERRFQGLETPGKIKAATAGCPRNCSEATVKDVGVMAIEGGRWEVYVGGAAGAHVRKGDLLATLDTQDEVLTLVGRFLQYYREQAKYAERSYAFVQRVGIAALRRVLVEDAEGIAGELDERIAAAVESWTDPWLEAEAPVHPAQFVPTLAGSAT
jgi:nitrite reductase (NADH) large subunit